MYNVAESSVELLSLVLTMFDFGEGPTTRSSIRGAKSEAPMKYITRAALHRASESEETKADALGGLPKSAKPKEDYCSKLAQSRSSSVFSEQERNLSILSDDEGFGSPTILPSIPSILARPHHQLSQVVFVYKFCHLTVCAKAWSLWYNRGDPSLTWAENQKVNLGNVDCRSEIEMLDHIYVFDDHLPSYAHCPGGGDNEDSRGVLAAAAVAQPSFLPSCRSRPRPLPRWGDCSSIFCGV